MAEIIENDHGGEKGKKRRPKKHGTHLDMTPMVDLMCLLITFFMLTTVFSKPKAMELVLPPKIKDNAKQDDVEIPKDRTLNIILGASDKIYWFIGVADPSKPMPEVVVTDYSKDGIRKVLLEKNKDLFLRVDSLKLDVLSGKKELPADSVTAIIKNLKKTDKLGPIVLIKADVDSAKYRNVVRIIDEMSIANIARYAIIDMTPTEKELIAKYSGVAVPAPAASTETEPKP